MQKTENTESIWRTDVPAHELPPIIRDLEAEVCVVGAGIAGLSVAYELGLAGLRVVVLDDKTVAGGETAQTSAHLASAVDDRFARLESIHGGGGAQLAYDSHAAAIDRIEQIVTTVGIECGFERVPGYLFLAQDDPIANLDEELQAAKRAGFEEAVLLERAPDFAFDTGPCIRFPNQGQFHPLRYLEGLVEALKTTGARIFGGAHVEEVHGGTAARVVTSAGHKVAANSIVVATNTPVNDRVAIHTKQVPYRTFAVAFELPRGSAPHTLLWDTGHPYHYVRGASTPRGDFLIVGGEDHKTGHYNDASVRFERLEAWARARFADLGPRTHAWSGQLLEPIDSLAFIGRNPLDRDNVFIATGDSGQGITHGVMAGLLICDLILGRPNPWETLYDPSRRSLRTIGEFTSNAVAMAAGYADWLRSSEVQSVSEIACGQGALLRRGTRLIAASRDDEGRLHTCSARCTHLGGVVHWNSAEKSWDCPLHGSRFDPNGAVLNGPAISGLAHVDDVADEAEPAPQQRRHHAA